MQEYLLYSQVAAAREHQVLSILSGFTGTQPTAFSERVLIFAQAKAPDATQTATKRALSSAAAAALRAQQAAASRLHYHKLIRTGPSAALDDTLSSAPVHGSWVFRAEQIPEPGTREWLSRSVVERPASVEDCEKFQNPQLYLYKTQYLIRGNQFTHGNIIIRVCQMLQDSKQSYSDALNGHDTPVDDAKLIDSSGSWLVEAVIRVEDGTNARLVGIATEELLAFKTELSGAVDLFMPDRLALDTRVKAV